MTGWEWAGVSLFAAAIIMPKVVEGIATAIFGTLIFLAFGWACLWLLGQVLRLALSISA